MASRPQRKRKAAPRKIARARNPRSEQRQRLIDACIAALHIYGPSRTTVEKVTAIAKMSPGIVRFYFASKASMLVASLQFLAAEFEEQVMHPVERLNSTPVAALELLVDLYLDAEIASPRKVSVWYAFWGEASSRQEYYDICGQKDERFAQLVFELIDALISESGQTHLDADGVALGLIGVLEMIWQDFAFKSEEGIDRVAAKGRCMAYLRSVFPGSFGAVGKRAASAQAKNPWAPWVYGEPSLFALERQRVFQGSWQFLGHVSQVQNAGEYIATDIAGDRVLAIRDEAGVLRAFRNSCVAVPHLLLSPGRGRANSIICESHGLRHALDGQAQGDESLSLTSLQLRLVNNLILVRSEHDADGFLHETWEDAVPAGVKAHFIAALEREIAADWKLIVESWLRDRVLPSDQAWSARAYAANVGQPMDSGRMQLFIGPNHWLDIRRDGFTVLQAIPREAGRTTLRQHDYSWGEAGHSRAAAYLAARVNGQLRNANVRSLESVQTSIVAYGYPLRHDANEPAQLTAFRRALAQRITVLQLEHRPRQLA